jgi:hypothetical protein
LPWPLGGPRSARRRRFTSIEPSSLANKARRNS